MKKRIFAASMASVMALSSVSVVAFADETVVAGTQESVNRAELKEYIKSFDSFLKDDIYELGTIQAEQFQNAYDYAENVAAASKPTDEDCTAAYQMLKRVYESLRPYSAEELKDLIADCKADYETENVLNEDLGDNIWSSTTFSDFEVEYDNAEMYVDSEDGRLITDAYIALYNAHEALNPLGQVTKSKFRAVLREFEAIANKQASYETWRRGKIGFKAVTGTNAGDVDISTAYYVTFDELIDTVYGNSTEKLVKDKKLTDLGDGTKTWINVGTTGGTVKAFVEAQYERFDKIRSSSITTHPDIKAAYDAAVEAVNVFNSWTKDDTDRAAKATINTTINKYRAQLVDEYLGQSGNDILGIKAAYTNFGDYSYGDKVWKTTADNTEIVLDKKTNLIAFASGSPVAVASADSTKHTVKKLAKGTDIMKYIPVAASDITSSDTDLALAFKIVEAYADAEAGTKTFADAYGTAGSTTANDLADLDENNVVAEPAGSRNEYTLINRFLAYALADKFPAADETVSHTKKEVQKLIDDCYDLCDLTGDSEVFSVKHLAVVEARKLASKWVTEANAMKGYKDGTEVEANIDIDGDNNEEKTATDVYNKLKAKYDALETQFKAFPMSYGELADFIAKVSMGIDDGSVAKTDKVVENLKKVAIGLSTLDASDDTNEAFTDEREFISYNRLQVADDTYVVSVAEQTLYADYLALVDAIEAGQTGDVVLGDVDGDGQPTAKDAKLVLQYAAGQIELTAAQIKAADFDGDGVPTAKDAKAILMAAAGMTE